MYYSEDLIEEVRSRTDIVDLISGYVRLSKRGANHIGLCPFHNEKTPSFIVSGGKQIFRCFGCGAGGNVFTFLMKYENLGFVEALKTLADRAGVTLPEYQDERAKKNADLRTKLFEINREAARFYHMELSGERGRYALQYLRERKLDDSVIRSFGLGYSPKGMGSLYHFLKEKGFDDESLKLSGLFTYREDKGPSDLFWNRVMFPIIDHRDKVIGFGGRVMGDGKPKYLNSPETPVFHKGRNLFSMNLARTSREDFIVICEGYMDVIALNKAGFKNAVASLGTALTSDQARLLSKYVKTVILMYDSDEAGIKAIKKALPILKEEGLLCKVADLSPYKDPDELITHAGKEELQKRLLESSNSFEFELKTGESEFDIDNPEERVKLMEKMIRGLLKVEERLERETYLSMLAERYHIPVEVLREHLNKLALTETTREEFAEAEKRITSVKERKGEEGDLKSERFLLSVITEYPYFYSKIKNILSVEDFSCALHRGVAALLFEQLENGGVGKPAVLISKYETEEEQQEVAALFGEKVEFDEKNEELKKAFTETVLKVKKAALERAMSKVTESGDMMKLLEIVQEQKHISEIRIEL